MRRDGTRLRLALPVALIFAIGLRFLCPPGWMLNPAGMTPLFVPCPAEGEMPAASDHMGMAMPMHGGEPAQPHAQTHQEHCVPGAWVMGGPAQAPVIGVPTSFAFDAAVGEPRPSPPSPPARHRPQAPRAPPLIA